MELEELKNSWKEMSERLDQKEILEKKLIKETITSRVHNIMGKNQEQSYRTTISWSCFF